VSPFAKAARAHRSSLRLCTYAFELLMHHLQVCACVCVCVCVTGVSGGADAGGVLGPRRLGPRVRVAGQRRHGDVSCCHCVCACASVCAHAVKTQGTRQWLILNIINKHVAFEVRGCGLLRPRAWARAHAAGAAAGVWCRAAACNKPCTPARRCLLRPLPSHLHDVRAACDATAAAAAGWMAWLHPRPHSMCCVLADTHPAAAMCVGVTHAAA
jgi:hypothetical protein